MKRLICIVFVITASPSFAQIPQPQTPAEQAMGNKIIQELQAGLSCNINLISLQLELDKAKIKIKELEDKEKK